MEYVGSGLLTDSESWRQCSDSPPSIDDFDILGDRLDSLLTPPSRNSPSEKVDEAELQDLVGRIKSLARTAFIPSESPSLIETLAGRVSRLSPDIDSPIKEAAKIVLYPIMLATHTTEQSDSPKPDEQINLPFLTADLVDDILEGSAAPQVIQLLGKGGQSSVEEIEYKGIRYARKTTMSSKEQALSFLFPHPNLMAPLFLSPTDGAIFPLAEGTIKDAITKPETTPLRFTNYLLQVSEALHHLHINGLVHRDIKAPNILIQDEKAFVADFGLSAFLTDRSKWDSPDGTPSHIAPELIAPTFIKGVDESKRYLTEKMDVFSFGITLHELLTGESWIYGKEIPKTPIGICLYLDQTEGKINFESMKKTIEASPLAQRLDPTGFWTMIMEKTLQVEPTDRPSMIEIIDLIHQHAHYLTEEPR